MTARRTVPREVRLIRMEPDLRALVKAYASGRSLSENHAMTELIAHGLNHVNGPALAATSPTHGPNRGGHDERTD